MASLTTNANAPATLSWAEDQSVPIHGPQELDKTLDALACQAEYDKHPLIVELVQPNDATLSIGVGRDESVLNYSRSPDPPYYTSLGDQDQDESDVVAYYYYGHWSEFPRRSCVPNDKAREAARRFLTDGERPNNVRWTQD